MAGNRTATKKKAKLPPHRPPHNGIKAYSTIAAIRMDVEMVQAISAYGNGLSDGFRNLSQMALIILDEGRRQLRHILKDRAEMRKIVNKYLDAGDQAVLTHDHRHTFLQKYALLDAVRRYCRAEEQPPIERLLD